MNKFVGEPDQFKGAINAIKLKGTWEDFEPGLRFKTKDGGVLLWYQTTGTIQIQGNKEAKEKLTEAVSKIDFDDFGNIAEEKSIVPELTKTTRNKSTSSAPEGRIFVVHGHDHTSREQLELVLHKLGLEPFVLANTSGGGLTIIEALEQEIGNDSKFGIVLLTPDDMGYSKSEGPDKVQPRARQNVVLEMGMLISAIGRKNTVILKKGHLDVPSDANGILYLGFNDHVKETVPRLVERLKQSGFEIETGKITKAAS